MGMETVPSLRKQSGNSSRGYMQRDRDPPLPVPQVHPTATNTCPRGDSSGHVHGHARQLLTSANAPVGEQMCSTHTMEYYPALKTGDILTPATAPDEP